jgi:hypothetical protein
MAFPEQIGKQILIYIIYALMGYTSGRRESGHVEREKGREKECRQERTCGKREKWTGHVRSKRKLEEHVVKLSSGCIASHPYSPSRAYLLKMPEIDRRGISRANG